ncbi:MAG TPA: hypothetical protein VJR29_13940 [bacterium]|nr:hypothetical protein [bacterium]
MSVELKNHLRNSPLTPSQQKEILATDTDRDGVLASSDLTARFGKQAAQRFFIDLQSSVQNNDFNRFRGTMGKLQEAKTQFFARAFQEGLMKNRAALEGLGVEFQGGKIRLSGVAAKHREAVAKTLAEILQGPYAGEFQTLSSQESRDFLLRVQDFVRGQGANSAAGPGGFHRIDQIARRLLIDEGSYWSKQAQAELGQQAFAEESFHEVHTPKHVADLEKKHGLDLRRAGGELNPAQAETLDRVLDRLRALAPNDFAKLSTVTLHLDLDRGGGLTHLEEGGRIDLYGPFSPPLTDAKLAASYAEDMAAIFGAGAETFLTQTLAHEMAHVTETKETMEFYRKTLPGVADRVLEERYAEDYRVFLFSGGRQVAARGADGRAIGHDAERLAFLQGHRQP